MCIFLCILMWEFVWFILYNVDIVYLEDFFIFFVMMFFFLYVGFFIKIDGKVDFGLWIGIRYIKKYIVI